MPCADKGKFIGMKVIAYSTDFTDFFICEISEISEKNYTLADNADSTDFLLAKSARNK